MSQYSSIKAAVNAYIKQNGRKEITGRILNAVLNATIDSLGKFYQFAGVAVPTTDPEDPDQNVCYLAGEPGTYTHFDNIVLENEEIALLFYNGTWTKQRMLIGIQEVSASVDSQTGTPSVDVSYSEGQLVLTFHNLKGDKGDTGDPAGFGSIGATVDSNIGTPGVTVVSSGPATAKELMFNFTNLKGETGVTSVIATVDNTQGTPSCTVSLVGQQLTLAFSGLKGLKGDTGVSADYPITIYNGLDSDATDQALSAYQGKVLDGKVTQLEAKVTDLNEESFNNFFTGDNNTYKSVNVYGLIRGQKYRLYVANPNYDHTGVTVAAYLFSINSFSNGVQTLLAGTSTDGNIPQFYDITIPNNSDYIRVGGRATQSTKVRFSIVQLDPIQKEIEAFGQQTPRITTGKNADLALVDGNGNCLALFIGGHFKTKYFNSEDVQGIFSSLKEKADISNTPQIANGNADLNLIDQNGNILASFVSGGVKTLHFDSGETNKKIEYLFSEYEKLAPKFSRYYYGDKIKINGNGFESKTWGVFPGVPLVQSFSVYGDYIVFVYGSPNYGEGSLWKISTKEKITDLTFPHTGYNAPHGNVAGFSNAFATGNTDLPLLYVSQWDNEGGCFVYDIHLDGTVNLVQTIMTDGNMGEGFGLALGDFVIDYRGGFLWSAKYKVSAYHQTGNGLMFCKFALPSTETSSVVLTASDILESFEISAESADLTVTQDKVINDGKMFILCGFGSSNDARYPGKLYVIDLLGHRVSSFIDIDAIHPGEPEGIAISGEDLLYGLGGSTVYSLTF